MKAALAKAFKKNPTVKCTLTEKLTPIFVDRQLEKNIYDAIINFVKQVKQVKYVRCSIEWGIRKSFN